MSADWVVLGLGNPGSEYEQTRHNLGFWVIDQLVQDLGLAPQKKADNIAVAAGKADGYRVLAAKPLTYVNRSGDAAAKLLRRTDLTPDRLLVIHDDIDMAEGTLRLRRSGSSGGHRGIESIIERLSTEDFARIKIGVGRPPGDADPADYVLEPLNRREKELLEEATWRAADLARAVLSEGLQAGEALAGQLRNPRGD